MVLSVEEESGSDGVLVFRLGGGRRRGNHETVRRGEGIEGRNEGAETGLAGGLRVVIPA